ncbi:hypothetical protein [Streptomyces sp. NPDC002913]
MAGTSRRHFSRTACASCLAVMIAVPGLGTAAAAPAAAHPVPAPHGTSPPPPPTQEPEDTPPPEGTPPPEDTSEPPDSPPPSDTSQSPDTPPSSDAPGTGESQKPEELKQEAQARVAKAPEAVKEDVEKALTTMLALIEDPHTTPEDRAAYESIVAGITAALKMVEDPRATPEDRATNTRIAGKISTSASSLSVSRSPSASGTSVQPRQTLADVSQAVSGVAASDTTPNDPKDRKRIQQIVEETCDALKVYEDPKASPEDKEKAQKKLAERTEALRNALYLELVKEIKRYKPSASCSDAIEDRTRQVGWADGSLWGLSDRSCAAPVAAGARQESSEWHELMECVLRDPFSTCVRYVPED